MTAPSAPPRFSIIIPARNEEARIETTIHDLCAGFRDSEVIVVLNGCSDRTPQIVRRIAPEYPNLVLLAIDDAIGKGGAVRAGMLVAKAPIVGYVDADGATSATEMRRLCESLGNLDGISASRWCRGAVVQVPQGAARRYASRVFNAIVRGLFGLRFTDTQCGAKVFRGDALRRVLPDIETANFAFDVDLLYSMKRARMRVEEVPTVWRDVRGSKVTLIRSGMRMLCAVLRLRARHSLLRYGVPLLDRLFPTAPIKTISGLHVLLLNWRDPQHPQAGGAEVYLHEMARRWVDAGHHVEWLTSRFPGAPSEELIDGIRITRVGNAATVYALLPLRYIRQFRDRFDVIVDAENGIPFFSPLFSMKPKVCVVHHVHQDVLKKYLPWPSGTVLAWLERRLMPALYSRHTFVAVSDDTRDALTRMGVPRKNIEVVHSGVDAHLRPGVKFPAPTFVYLGRLKKYKRVHLILNAFAQVRRFVPDATLHIAGDGDDLPRLKKLARKLGLDKRVVFDGAVSWQRKLELLQGAWAYVSASEIEGWGIGVIEANACGTPAIAFDVPGLRESITDGLSGLLAPEGGDLGTGMLAVVLDRSLRHRLRAGALQRAAAFSWDSSAAVMMDVLMRAAAGGRYSFMRLSAGWNLLKYADRRGEEGFVCSVPLAATTAKGGGADA